MGPALIILFGLLWAAGFALGARLRHRERTLPACHLPRPAEGLRDAATLTVIIPARNEEHNLPRLLASLAAQTPRPGEVLVVDDASTDRTATVARNGGARVIPSQPLPDGWRGKTWACHQGALAATGDWLLFMDADTWLEPDGLARLLGRAGAGVLAVLPFHAVRRPYESLSLFFNIAMAAGTIPDGLSGQVLLVQHGDYRRAGGHEAVRGEVLENFRLAAGFRAAGVAVACVPGRGMVSFRMYPGGIGELVAGWMKGFAAGAGGTPPAVLALVIGWFTALMLPPLFGAVGGWWWAAGAAFLLCVAQVAWLARRLGSFGWLACLCYLVPLLFFFGLFGVAALRKGRKAKWKGREFDVP